MTTLLKVIAGIWLAIGAWTLWRSIGALGRVNEAIQPVGSRLVGEHVLSAVLVFIVPGFVALALAGSLSARRLS